MQAEVIIELVVFETLWIFMVWSHSMTMCSEPGFIPINYQYEANKLPDKYKVFFESNNPIEHSKSFNAGKAKALLS